MSTALSIGKAPRPSFWRKGLSATNAAHVNPPSESVAAVDRAAPSWLAAATAWDPHQLTQNAVTAGEPVRVNTIRNAVM